MQQGEMVQGGLTTSRGRRSASGFKTKTNYTTGPDPELNAASASRSTLATSDDKLSTIFLSYLCFLLTSARDY